MTRFSYTWYLAAWNALNVDMHDEKQSATSEDEFVDVENDSVENGEISSKGVQPSLLEKCLKSSV